MTARTVLTTNTLEEFRTTFNSLSQTDIGDPATLTTTATSVVGAINEVATAVTTAFKVADDTSTQQTINSGDVLRFSSDSNTTAVVSATDTITIGLASTISGLTSISATTLTDGTATISGGTINATTITESSVRVATRPFAIAQAVALG
jgi:aspartyl aminopeptidase